MEQKPYYDLNTFLRERFGCRVQKISLDAGLGCPNRDGSKGRGGCIYCNERGSGTGKAANQSLTEQLVSAKSFLAERYKARKFLGYFQSFSNTYASLPVLKRLYNEVLADPDVVGLCIGTRPDCVDEEKLDYLAELAGSALIWVEYGLQSAHEATLAAINRGHGVDAFREAVRRSRDRGLLTCAHVVLGLPGESREDMLETACFLAEQGVDAVKIHGLYVVRGTRLHQLYGTGDYRPLRREEYVPLVGDFLARLPGWMVVQRITGDPHRQELVAPEWMLDKKRNLQEIQQYMVANGLVQGSRCGGGGSAGRDGIA
jgi:hypothetical protein